jgi:mannose-6-phosphate isomerase-like protein (cupin superfamily)
MKDFPAFVKNPLNRIATSSQYTEDLEGYVFDGADGSQVAFWACAQDRVSASHIHDFDEYMVVIQGRCVVTMGENQVELGVGDELLIPKGTPQSITVAAGTRTVHVFGAKRAEREREVAPAATLESPSP